MTLGRLVDGLASRGHRITIVRPRQRHESPRFSVTHRVACRQVRLPGVPIPGYPQLRLGLPAARRLRQQWKLNRPDLVHVATEGPLGASAITTARRMGIPVTSSFHTNFDQYTRDYRIGWMKHIVAAWLQHVHNRTLRTFVPTRDLLVRLEGEGYLNLRLLSRGVDAELFNPARRDLDLRAAWGVEPDDLAVLHVGRMAAEKNYPLLFRAFDAIKAVQPKALPHPRRRRPAALRPTSGSARTPCSPASTPGPTSPGTMRPATSTCTPASPRRSAMLSPRP